MISFNFLFQPVSTSPLASSSQDQAEDTTSQDVISDVPPRTPPAKISVLGPTSSGVPLLSPGPNSFTAGGTTLATATSALGSLQRVPDSPLPTTSVSTSLKEEDNPGFLGRRPSPAPIELGLGRGAIRGPSLSGGSPGISIPLTPGPSGLPLVSDGPKSSSLSQSLPSPMSSRMMSQQFGGANEGSGDSSHTSEGPVIGRAFSPSVVAGVQWRPQSIAGFPNQSDTVCIFILFVHFYWFPILNLGLFKLSLLS